MLDVPLWVWLVSILALLAVVAVDLVIVDRNPHEVSVKEAGTWVGVYVGLAVLFGLGLLVVSGPSISGQFFAGWITEYSLSVDNLFVFVIIMASFGVPLVHQHKVLLVGILIALALRGVFIAVGAAAIERFQWVFYLFGAFLILTAARLAKEQFTEDDDDEDDFSENILLRGMRRVLPVSEDYDGSRLTTRTAGSWMVTPMLVVMVAIGSTDVLFALDSIPAIFGLTQEPYLVFAANAFALMGLRQLYFLIGGLLQRLVYLSLGLSVVLAFIGVKLILEALHGGGVDWAPEIPVVVSLGTIVAILAVTTAASLARVKRHPEEAKHVPGQDPVR